MKILKGNVGSFWVRHGRQDFQSNWKISRDGVIVAQYHRFTCGSHAGVSAPGTKSTWRFPNSIRSHHSCRLRLQIRALENIISPISSVDPPRREGSSTNLTGLTPLQEVTVGSTVTPPARDDFFGLNSRFIDGGLPDPLRDRMTTLERRQQGEANGASIERGSSPRSDGKKSTKAERQGSRLRKRVSWQAKKDIERKK